MTLTEKNDQELIREQNGEVGETNEIEYMVEVLPPEVSSDKLPSYAISNYDKAKQYFIQCMKLDQGI